MTYAQNSKMDETRRSNCAPGRLYRQIKILAFGEAPTGNQYVKLGRGLGLKPIIFRIDNLATNRAAAFQLLNRQGLHLISPAAQAELIKRIQEHDPRGKKFSVAEDVGMFYDTCFILPDEAIPSLPKDVEICVNDIRADVIARHQVSGTLDGWRELAAYGKGNSRLMFAFALNFIGPTCALWERQSVAFQFTAKGGAGKSSIAVVSTSAWGWDPVNGKKYGFGTSWNTTDNKLELTCRAYNHTILFLDETGAHTGSERGAVDNLDAVMRIDGQLEKDRLTNVGSRLTWSMPILSTSNVSVPEMLAARRRKGSAPIDARVYCDRLIDIPAPAAGHGMYEHLHGFDDGGKLSEHLKTLAAANHGLAAREFVEHFLTEYQNDEAGVKAFLDARSQAYERKAREKISASEAHVRVHHKLQRCTRRALLLSSTAFCLTRESNCSQRSSDANATTLRWSMGRWRA